MKTYTFLIIAILFKLNIFAQNQNITRNPLPEDIKPYLDLNNYEDCGQWIGDIYYLGEWKDIDTLLKTNDIPKEREWVTMPKWDSFIKESSFTKSQYCPCGCKPTIKTYNQYRICRITGIHQGRLMVIDYYYVKPGESEYDQVKRSFMYQQMLNQDHPLLKNKK